jgi:hypothetical protein
MHLFCISRRRLHIDNNGYVIGFLMTTCVVVNVDDDAEQKGATMLQNCDYYYDECMFRSSEGLGERLLTSNAEHLVPYPVLRLARESWWRAEDWNEEWEISGDMVFVEDEEDFADYVGAANEKEAAMYRLILNQFLEMDEGMWQDYITFDEDDAYLTVYMGLPQALYEHYKVRVDGPQELPYSVEKSEVEDE